VRDEAHRFAITAHRRRRSKGMTVSALDQIPGLGPSRQAALLAAFGSVRKLREATLDEVAAIPGFGPTTAAAVLQALTGEVASHEGPQDAPADRPGRIEA
jgi:excinuclease ABC subunit C